MNVYNGQYLLDRIKETEYKQADVFTGHVIDPKDKSSVCHIRFKGGEHVAAGLRRFVEGTNGRFTVFLRQRLGSPISTAEVLHLSLNNSAVTMNGTPSDPEATRDRLKMEIMREIRAEQDAERIAQELEELKQTNERLQQPLNKAATVLEIVALKFIDRFAPEQQPAAPVQVMNGAASTSSNGNETSADQLENCLTKLVEMFGAGGVVSLVEKLENDESLQGIVKNYI